MIISINDYCHYYDCEMNFLFLFHSYLQIPQSLLFSRLLATDNTYFFVR